MVLAGCDARPASPDPSPPIVTVGEPVLVPARAHTEAQVDDTREVRRRFQALAERWSALEEDLRASDMEFGRDERIADRVDDRIAEVRSDIDDLYATGGTAWMQSIVEIRAELDGLDEMLVKARRAAAGSTQTTL